MMKNYEVSPMFFGFYIRKEEEHYVVITQSHIFDEPSKFHVTLEGLKLMVERLNAVIEEEEKEEEGGEG